MKQLFNKLARKAVALGLAGFSLCGGMSISGCERRPDEQPEQQGTPPVVIQPSNAVPVTQKELDIVNNYWATARALESGEIVLVRKLFGNEIDLSNGQILTYAAHHSDLAANVMEGEKNIIHIYGDRYSSADYSAENDIYRYGLFAFEITRIWQQQTDKQWTKGTHLGYAYRLHNLLSFPDYGPLQQAAIIMDYAQRFFHPAHQSTWMHKTYGPNNCDADLFLINLVEKQFPHAREAHARLRQQYGRLLTHGESSLATLIFGEQIETANIVNELNPVSCAPKLAWVDSPYKITYWGNPNHSSDYAREKSSEKLGVYMHEMTHIWQRQTGFKFTNASFVNTPNAYRYPVDVKKWKFTDYSAEQQGAIMQDYAGYFLHKGKSTAWLSTTNSNLDGLKALVENQFPGAKIVREYFEKHGVLPFYAPLVSANTTVAQSNLSPSSP